MFRFHFSHTKGNPLSMSYIYIYIHIIYISPQSRTISHCSDAIPKVDIEHLGWKAPQEVDSLTFCWVGSEIYLIRALRFYPGRSGKCTRMEAVQQPRANCSNTWLPHSDFLPQCSVGSSWIIVLKRNVLFHLVVTIPINIFLCLNLCWRISRVQTAFL